MTAYSPWGDLGSRPHLQLFRQQLDDELGYTDGRAIVLDPRQRRAQARATLAHELAHLDLGHMDVDVDATPDGERLAHRHELQADELAARRLISLGALVDALVWSQDDHELARELRVDVATVRTRLETLRDVETKFINSRLDQIERGLP